MQLARKLGAVLVEECETCDLLFDTAGGDSLARNAGNTARVVTIAAETPGAQYFIVEPDGAQLASLPELRPQVDSVFALADFEAVFARSAERGKHGKVVLRVG